MVSGTKQRDRIAGGHGNRLTERVQEFDVCEGSLTASQIGIACKAALSDFVRGETSSTAISNVARLLGVAVRARRDEMDEKRSLYSAFSHLGQTPN